MIDMVERVALAILEEIDRGNIIYCESSDGLDSVLVDGDIDLLKVARAALTAMREPTEAIIEAGNTAFEDNPGDRWRDMIDEALK